MKNKAMLLFVEPTKEPTDPIMDQLTGMVEHIMSLARLSEYGYRGAHTTPFGVSSDNKDWLFDIPMGVTNSLAVYYTACHREDMIEEVEAISEWYDALTNMGQYLRGKIQQDGEYFIRAYYAKRYTSPITTYFHCLGKAEDIREQFDNVLFDVITEKEFIEEAGREIRDLSKEGFVSVQFANT